MSVEYRRSHPVRQRRFSLLIGLFLTVVVAGNLAIAVVVNSAIGEINTVAERSSLQTALSLINDSKTKLDRLAVDFTWWNEAVDRAVLQLDEDWADTNLGNYFYKEEGISHTALLSRGGRVLYISVDGARRDPDAYPEIKSRLSAVLARSSNATIEKPMVVNDVVKFRDQVYLVSAAAITPFEKTYPDSDKILGAVSLVLMLPVNEAYLSRLRENYGLLALSLGDERPQNKLSLPLDDFGGHNVGNLSWSIELPGNELLSDVAPAIGTLLLFLLIATVAFIKNIQRLHAILIQDNEKLVLLSHEIEKANSDLERLTYLDGLSGIANRRRFDEALNVECSRSQRSQQFLSVILIDVDFFKAFNDTYGHLDGDKCLRAVGKSIENCAKRPSDLVARYGGRSSSVFCLESMLPRQKE